MRRRRNEVTVEIRKTKRDDTLQKRRNVPLTEDTTDEEEGRGENLSAASLDTIVERAMSPEPATQLAAVQVPGFFPRIPVSHWGICSTQKLSGVSIRIASSLKVKMHCGVIFTVSTLYWCGWNFSFLCKSKTFCLAGFIMFLSECEVTRRIAEIDRCK
jgi:hypothetical protein